MSNCIIKFPLENFGVYTYAQTLLFHNSWQQHKLYNVWYAPRQWRDALARRAKYIISQAKKQTFDAKIMPTVPVSFTFLKLVQPLPHIPYTYIVLLNYILINHLITYTITNTNTFVWQNKWRTVRLYFFNNLIN